MKLVLFAHKKVGYECIRFLFNNSIQQFVVLPKSKNFNDNNYTKEFLKKNKIPFMEVSSMNKKGLFEKLVEFNAKACFSCYFPKIIPLKILSIFNNGSFNLHGGLLPHYMGTFSGAWSIINDEKKTGSTLHLMDEKVDVGDIVEVRYVSISNNDTGISLYNKVALKSIDLFKKYSLQIVKNIKVNSTPQNLSEASYYKRQVPYNGIIQWSWDSRKVYNFCRALEFPPFKNAISLLDEKEIEVMKCKEIINGKINKKHGEILSINKDGILIACHKNNILITKIKMENKIFSNFKKLPFINKKYIGSKI